MRKNNNRWLAAACILLCCFSYSAAQGTKVPIEKCSAIKKSAYNRLVGVSYRRTHLFEKIVQNLAAPVLIARQIKEFVPPNSRREVTESFSSDGVHRTENVKIGADEYFKYGDGPWYRGHDEPVFDENREWTGDCTLRKTSIDGQRADLYEVVGKMLFVVGKISVSLNIKDDLWISASGRLLKEVDEDYTPGSEKFPRNTYTYESDVKLKITAPIK